MKVQLSPKNKPDVLLYSLGSIDEEHGPALPGMIDDVIAVRSAFDIFVQAGFRYRKHLPYVSDRVGEIARDWCPHWMPREKLVGRVISDIRADAARWPRTVSHVVLINGHGGNNFLKEREQDISERIGIPFLFIVPLEGDGVMDPKLGRVECVHADTGEHSLAAYLGVLNTTRLRDINRTAAESPEKALKRWKALAGLGGYVLYGGPRYRELRRPEYGLLKAAESFLRNPKIIGDPGIGGKLYRKHLNRSLRLIRAFVS
jgi:creatinine amidohydrolase/Fe(II)-dependent formamide hydrolase-like protein